MGVLCDDISTFLAAHDDLTLLREASAAPAAPAPKRAGALYAAAPAPTSKRGRGRPSTRLYATARDDDAALAFPVAPEDLERAALALERGLVERSAEARLVLLGAATREHVLLVGPPGVGKSLLCRRLGALFSENDSYFEVALTRFTTPDDVFGPLSLKALREDQAKRAADGFAGGAEVVFLDEIFRARALLPALLQLLNERTWPDGSRNRPAKLVSAVAATNALRDADDDDDDALFDRFLFRRAVAPVSDAGALDLLLTDDGDARDDAAALLAPLREALRGARATLPKRRAAVLASCRAWLRDERGEYVSDRRLRRCSEAIRAAALACGRTEVGAIDLLLAADALWQRPETRAPLVEWLIDHAVPDDAATMRLLLDALRARDAPSEQDAEEIVAAATAARTDLAADAAATAESTCVFLAPAALAAAKQALASLYAERLSALDAVLESATAVRDAIRAGEPLPVAEDSAPSASERVDWDEEDDDESDGKRRKKKRKKKR
jgi:MoxR-like ATPase